MKQTVYYPFFICSLLFVLFILSCSKARTEGEWLIDNNLINEGEGKNEIPALNDPVFLPATAIDFLADTSVVLGVQIDGEIRAYPLNILHWHEIVNDQIGTTPVAITYSTLSGSGIAFERIVDSVLLEFGVSGLLYNANLILFDDVSNSHWLQFQQKAINGFKLHQTFNSLPLIEMNWKTWRLLFPNSQVLTTKTGFNRPYDIYPYGDYQTDTTKIFFEKNLTVPLDSLPRPFSFKDKVLGVIIGDDAKVYPFPVFPAQGVQIIEDEFQGEPLVIIGSQEHDFIVAYSRKRPIDGTIANFQIADEALLTIKDDRGQEFNVFGQSTDGNAINNLSTVRSNMAYWFTWSVFYPHVEVYQ